MSQVGNTVGPSYRRCSLFDFMIGDAGAAALSEALKSNATLTLLE
jgi:hypothetical protein